jgi:hypothetical protein
MGTKLIIKGADFSNVAVSRSSNYKKVAVGVSESLWPNALVEATVGTAGYGYLVNKNGYITQVKVDANSDQGAITPVVSIFNEGETDDTAYVDRSTLTESVTQGVKTYNLTKPLQIAEGQVVVLKGVAFYYAQTGGDAVTNSYQGVVNEANSHRIYRISFVMLEEEV